MAHAAVLLVIAMALLATATSSDALSPAGHLMDPHDIKKTIKQNEGDVIDCVDINRQPSLKHKHPLFRDHKVQLKPTRSWKAKLEEEESSKLSSRVGAWQRADQSWRRSGGSCPQGTVPIRRTPNGSAVDAAVAADAIRRSFSPAPSPSAGAAGDQAVGPQDGAAAAGPRIEVAASYAVNGPYHGAYAMLPVWKAHVEPKEASHTYLHVAGTTNPTYVPFPGEDPPDLNNAVWVGLSQFPSMFGDDNPRLFVYYTTDNGQKHYCYNTGCAGFVQTSSRIALGGTFANFSAPGGSQIFLSVSIYKEVGEHQWWVSVMDEVLGYFPHFIFPRFFYEGLHNEMGGRVLNTWPQGRHTATQMGSGVLPAAADPQKSPAALVAAYFALNVTGHDFPDIARKKTVVTAPGCYGVQLGGDDRSVQGFDTLFGGPGGPDCAS
ncbi:unnamed protein product [Urochloa decumbens]|uniref:Neprosin PEP catalytic domain-containing protein n=1 Tax=Urochloa decumbens TaxID=240449 RepID=A0ABC9FUV4_9POAL